MSKEATKVTKQITVETIKVSQLKSEFGNPRKIKKKNYQELEHSLDTYGDFGLILIDEKNNIIAGNQRVNILRTKDPDVEVLAKRLIGYTEAELRAINIKDNIHSGEWDLELLADWTADLNLDLGLDLLDDDLDAKKIKQMELVNYEKYDYVMIVCRNELDYLDLTRKLGIDGAVVKINEKKKIKARAVWYDKTKL